MATEVRSSVAQEALTVFDARLVDVKSVSGSSHSLDASNRARVTVCSPDSTQKPLVRE